ncbi:hypothetical protein ACHAWC_007149 [Mediolabrus comicus]
MAVTADVSSPQKSTVERLPHPNMEASKQSADAMECAPTGSADGASNNNDIVPTVSHDMSTAISSDDSVDSKQKVKPKKRKSKESESRNNSNEEQSSKKNKKKKAKDPNAPKRNVSAYLHYSSAKRGDVKESQPDLSFGEITKVVTASWKALSVEERVPWDEKAAADKKRYEDELAAYKDSEQALNWQARMAAEEGKKQSTSVSNSDKNAKEKSKKKSEAKEKNKKKNKKQQVKKPMSAHMHFSLANRADVKEGQPDLSASEVTSTVATNWKALSADERSFWEEKAAADEERYQKELAAQDMLEG